MENKGKITVTFEIESDGADYTCATIAKVEGEFSASVIYGILYETLDKCVAEDFPIAPIRPIR